MPFEKGKSGNPGGRPKSKPFRTALMLELKRAGENMPELREVARGLVDRAKRNDTACKELIDRLDGRALQPIGGNRESDPIDVVHRIERVIVDPQREET